jgi:hypothetical protein
MMLEEPGTDNLQWRKARRSANNGACVEVAPANGHVLVRDSKNQDGLIMSYSADSWYVFLAGARAGQFDLDCL